MQKQSWRPAAWDSSSSRSHNTHTTAATTVQYPSTLAHTTAQRAILNCEADAARGWGSESGHRASATFESGGGSLTGPRLHRLQEFQEDFKMTAGGAWRRPRMKVYDYNQEFGGNYYQVSQIFLSRGLHNIQRIWHSAFWAFAFSIHDRWYLLKTFLYIFFCFEGLSWSQYSLRGLSINLTSFFYVLNFVTKSGVVS